MTYVSEIPFINALICLTFYLCSYISHYALGACEL